MILRMTSGPAEFSIFLPNLLPSYFLVAEKNSV